MSMQEQLNVAAHTTEQAPLSTYENICGMVDISPVADEIKLDSYYIFSKKSDCAYLVV